MRVAETRVYKFEELSEKAKSKVINNTISFILDNVEYEDMSEKMQSACNKAEEMLTPWFTASYIYDVCLDEVIETIEDNGWEFTVIGNIF